MDAQDTRQVLWAVHQDWQWTASRIVRTTKVLTYVLVGGRQRQLRSEDVRCILPETEAKALAEKLVSSVALKTQEQIAATHRHVKRVDALCTEANAALAKVSAP